MTDIMHRLHCTIRCDIETAASGCHCAEARDEITRLRAEVERLRSGGCARDQGTTQYCAEAAILAAKVGKLEAECFSLAAWQCKFADGKTGLVAAEGGDTYCAMAKEVERLRAENERLRAALKTISDMTDYGTETATRRMTSVIHNTNVIARAALDGQHAPGKEEA